MACTPSDNSINPPVLPPINLPGVPGFGNLVSPIQIPLGDFSIPEEIIEDILELIQSLGALFPSGLFKSFFDFKTKNPLDVIANILTQIAPFLSLYNFFMALLNIIGCIIDVLCAIPNPFKLVKAIKKLFAECLPPFFNLFPFLALIAMIIALLLLILALIEFLIETVLKIITEIIKNIADFANAVRLQDAEATLAIATKIASLLCFINNLMAIFVGLAAIMAIIKSLGKLAGISFCADGGEESCCSDDVCPPFIKQSPNGIQGTNGHLIYHKAINSDVANIFGSIPNAENLISLPPLREERWQFLDFSNNITFPFKSIITPIVEDGNIFYPETSYTATTPVKKSPYTVNMRLFVNPKVFNSADFKGPRFFKIKDCIVVRKPYVGLFDFQGVFQPGSSSDNGTLNLEGGKVFEDDGTTAYLVNGKQATLNNFIKFASVSAASQSDLPTTDDEYTVSGISFTLNIGHAALLENNLITLGCIPEASVEREVQNSLVDKRPIIDKLPAVPGGDGFLPNVLGAQQCIQNALDKFRKSISVESAAVFQLETEACLGNLRNQTEFAICGAIIAATSQFQSIVNLNADIQFTTRSIQISVILKDSGGTTLSNNIPGTCVPKIEEKLQATVTFGTVSKFTYDGSQAFIAKISSTTAGSGEVQISFDNKIISTVIPATINTNSVIKPVKLTYTFIDAATDATERRDQSDISGDN